MLIISIPTDGPKCRYFNPRYLSQKKIFLVSCTNNWLRYIHSIYEQEELGELRTIDDPGLFRESGVELESYLMYGKWNLRQGS